MSMDARMENSHAGSSADRRHSVSCFAPQHTCSHSTNKTSINERQILDRNRKEIEEIWLEVLERIHYPGLKEFLYKAGKLIFISFGPGEHHIFTIFI
jgi:hypothetical protein